MTAVVLVLAVGVWGTMAYLSTLSNEKENTFTGSKGIQLELTEPYWDGTNDEWKTAKDLDGSTDLDLKDKGETVAGNYTPGSVIGKNPILTNNSNAAKDNSPEWVAIAVSYSID